MLTLGGLLQVQARAQMGSLANSVLTLEPGQQADAAPLKASPSLAKRSARNTGDSGTSLTG